MCVCVFFVVSTTLLDWSSDESTMPLPSAGLKHQPEHIHLDEDDLAFGKAVDRQTKRESSFVAKGERWEPATTQARATVP